MFILNGWGKGEFGDGQQLLLLARVCRYYSGIKVK